MAYSDITFKDKNPIKRWLQQQRLYTASRIAAGMNPKYILDFGAGNGELCKIIALQFPEAKIICYEPTPNLMDEAKENLVNLRNVVFCNELGELADNSVGLIFCLEVFEHLPEKETEDALRQFKRLLIDNGSAIVGVPVEVGFPALYKGIFRITRRFGAFDASIKNILLSLFYFPPSNRTASEIAPGFSFYYEHMGFDYRKLQALLYSKFKIERVVAGPISFFGTWLNPEVNFLVRKANSLSQPTAYGGD